MRLPVAIFPVSLLLVCIALAAGIVWQRTLPPSEIKLSEPKPPPPAVEAFEGRAKFVAPPRASFKQMAARPLFTASRRPQRAPKPVIRIKPAPRQAPMPSRDLLLLGIAMGAGEKLALIKTANPRAVVNVAEGQWINGWKVVKIFADGVRLKASRHILQLAFPKNSGKPKLRTRGKRR